MVRPWVVFPLFFACEPEKEPPEDTAPSQVLTWSYVVGPAPWDGLLIGLSPEDPTAEPYVLDADGAAVELELRDTPYVSPPLWGGPDGLAPGDYTLAGWNGEDHGLTEVFTVGEYGVGLDLDPALLTGRTYELDPASVWLGGLHVEGFIEDARIFLIFDAADADGTDFRVLVRDDALTCQALHGAAGLDADGLLTWSSMAEALSTEPAMNAEDLTLLAGFSPDGERIAGAQLRATVDTREMSAYVYESDDPTGLCEAWANAFGATCLACEDGVSACVDFAFYGGQLARVDEAFEEELQTCQVLLEEDLIPECSCASDGRGGAASGWAALGLGLALAARRRRG